MSRHVLVYQSSVSIMTMSHLRETRHSVAHLLGMCIVFGSSIHRSAQRDSPLPAFERPGI
jgi:hypothetical protein